ncbi:MAG TPA: Fur family transcriptional regulator [Myxococcota bacterium]|nr:Fur family transcriptional regulator [Myxococcota bacterium]
MSDVEASLERFRAYLASQGLRLTDQREAIAQVFFGSTQHLSLPDILDLARANRSGIGYATVYRTMRLLAEGGFADEHNFGENHTRYEVRDDDAHHDHLICVACGRIVEFEEPLVEEIQERVAARHGFTVVSHRHEIYGRCVPSCPAEPST